MARAAWVPRLWTRGFLLLCGVCVWVWVVFGLGFPLHPATPGWGDGVGVCLCARSACTPPLLAWVCGVGVCAWARVSAAPRHSWLGCWGVCVFPCALRLYPAFPSWGVWCVCVCLGSDFGCTPPPLAGVLGCLCACVRAPLVPRHSWLGCVVWVCVSGLGFRLRPATPGWGVGVRVCSCARSACAPPLLAGVHGVGVCAWAWHSAAPATPGWGVGVCACSRARSACTPPLLAGVCGVGVCAWAWVSAAPRLSWVGWSGVCVLLCPLRVYSPLLAGLCGVGVCVWARVSAAPRLSWLGCWGVCVFVYPLRLYPATLGWGMRCACVCLGLGLGCAPQLLAGVLGCVCVRVPAPLLPRLSWLGCMVRVCVFGLGYRLRPATPGWDVGLCLCLCARSACTPPLLAGPCAVGVCASAWVSAAPRHFWLGCWCVCVLVCPLCLDRATAG